MSPYIMKHTSFSLKYFYVTFRFVLLIDEKDNTNFIKYKINNNKLLMNELLRVHGFNKYSTIYDINWNLININDIYLYDEIIVKYNCEMYDIIIKTKLNTPNKLIKNVKYELNHVITNDHMKNIIDCDTKMADKINLNISILDYDRIKHIVDDFDLINKILIIINKNMKSCKISGDIQYLILSDILFGILQNDVIYKNTKTSREQYINYICDRIKIYNYVHNNYLLLHLKIIAMLIKENILKKNSVIIPNKNSYETWIYLFFNDNNIISNDFYIDISLTPWYYKKINNYHYCISSFRNIIRSYRKNRLIDNYNYVDYESINNMSNIKFIFNEKMIECNLIFLNEYKKKFEEKLNINELSLYKDSDYIDRKFVEEKLSEIHILIIIFNKIKINKEFYLPSFIDFRGRYYYDSYLSPTYNKIIRSLISINKDKDININSLYNSSFYKNIIKYKYLISKLNIKININLDNYKLYYIIYLYIEVGKNFILNDGSKYEFSTEEIIKLGIYNYNNRTFNKKLCENIKLNNIYNALYNAINNNIYDWNIEIEKDATASGFLNLCIVYKIKNPDLLKIINRSGDNYCDIYTYFIIKFMNNVDDKYSFIKNRKILKKLIMTVPYGAGFNKCFYEFVKNINLEYGIVYDNLDDNEKDYIKNIIREFHKNIENDSIDLIYDVKDISYKRKSYYYNKVIKTFEHEFKINVTNNDPFNKYTLRNKYKNILEILENDDEKCMRAYVANNMHNLDSEYIKKLLDINFDGIFIHDCVITKMYSLHEIMDFTNKYYSKFDNNDNEYCIWILK